MSTAFPQWLEPMAATLTQERFTAPEWIFERKYDGIRALAFKQGRDVKLLSRNKLPQHSPSVLDAIARLDVKDAILDGELSWHDEDAISYHVFDLLWCNGRDLTRIALEARKALLAALEFEPPIECVQTLDDAKPWERACAEGWEGVIAKRRDAPYEHRRSRHWLKMKCEATQELVVGGFTDPQGGRVGLGALLVGFYEPGGDHFVYAGKVGTGFDTKLLRALRERLDRLQVPATPFTKATGLPRVRAHWVRPEIVVQVSFVEWTVHGKLRHSRLVRLLEDRSARDVVRETP